MTSHASEKVSERFAAEVRDWTPVPVQGLARVVFAPVSSDALVTEHCRSILSEGERDRSARFIAEDLRANFIQRRAFRRYCGALALATSEPLAQIAFAETEKGRPYLPAQPHLWFSFSTSRIGFLGAWSSTRAIGVDLEDVTREVEAVELATRFFTTAEAQAVALAPSPQRFFLQLWSLKEAALKSIGEGLPFGLDAFAFELAPRLRVIAAPGDHAGADAFSAHLIDRPNICAAVVIRNAGDRSA